MEEKRIPHIHCPVNGWDCPHYTDEGQSCLCTLENPMENCDDFAAMWDRDDDYIDDDWIQSDNQVTGISTSLPGRKREQFVNNRSF